MTEAHVRVENLRKTYQTRNDEIEAIREVQMEVAEGEFISILGPSGCGKSTLFRHCRCRRRKCLKTTARYRRGFSGPCSNALADNLKECPIPN